MAEQPTCEVCYERPATHLTEVMGSDSTDAVNLTCDPCTEQARLDPDIRIESLECGATVNIGVEDSAVCDLPPWTRHSTHEGPTSLGGRASWSGGGSCAGDPLPVRNLKMTP
jgi:hypothetical protein